MNKLELVCYTRQTLLWKKNFGKFHIGKIKAGIVIKVSQYIYDCLNNCTIKKIIMKLSVWPYRCRVKSFSTFNG